MVSLKNSIRKMRYRHKLAAIIFMFSLLPIIILGYFLFSSSWKQQIGEILSKNREQLESGANSIELVLEANINKIFYINQNYYIRNYLETKREQSLVGIMSFNDYLQSVMGAIRADNSGTGVVIYVLEEMDYNSDFIRSYNLFEADLEEHERDLPQAILASGESAILWRMRHINPGYFNNSDQTEYLCAYQKIATFTANLAITEIRIPFADIAAAFRYDIPEGSFIVFRENENDLIRLVNTGTAEKETVLEQAGLESSQKKNDAYEVLTVALKAGIGTFEMYIPKSVMNDSLKRFMASVGLIALAIMVLLLLAVEIISYFLTKKLVRLLQKMDTDVDKLMATDALDANPTGDEFGTIEQRFYELVEKVHLYYRKIASFEVERKLLETRLLQERFNPHFLYNTLSTLRWISTDEKVHKVINSLVKYYRIALNKGSSIVTVSQELEMIEEYFNLQKFAYGNEFEYAIETEEGTGGILVLKHLLQPIVENAVLHGMNGRKSGGFIRVTVVKKEERLEFVIEDNGQGMDPARAEALVNGRQAGPAGGYGMQNVRKRIEVFYGGEGRFTIQSAPQTGTRVTLIVPCRLDPEIEHFRTESGN